MESSFLSEFWNSTLEWLNTIPWNKVDDVPGALDQFGAGFKEYGPKIALLEPHLDKVQPFLRLLESPVTQLAVSGLPLLSLSVNLLKIYLQESKIEPSFESSVLLLAQLGYLESLKGVLQKWLAQNPSSQSQLDTVAFQQVFQDQIVQLTALGLSTTAAKSTLCEFPTSDIARILDDSLREQLQTTPLNQIQIDALVDRVKWGTRLDIYRATQEFKDVVAPLAEFMRQGALLGAERDISIEKYLKEEIDQFPQELIFGEAGLTVQDLYVQLNVQPLDSQGEPLKLVSETGCDGLVSPVNIHGWVQRQLEAQSARRQVIFIQGEAGRGKSVFCRMFAKWVREALYPSFIPIVVRLRELRDIENTLRETLENLLDNVDFVQSDSGWLTDSNTRFLIIFDGFDELALQGQSANGLRDFLAQVEWFQQRSHHQCLITGRPLALHGLERQIGQMKFVRARLEQMNDDQRNQWLTKWARQFSQPEADQFRAFLQACPEDIENNLAREPLLLYLLGRLHREGHLNVQMFDGTQGIHAKVLIYDSSIHWVLEKQRQEIQPQLTGLETEDLREVLQETALCVMQSGTESASLSMIETRFSDNQRPVFRLWQQAKASTGKNTARALNNLLTTFYFQPDKKDQTGSVEFAHKSFSEFLFAERLTQSLEDWICLDSKGRRYAIDDRQMAWQIYDLLGYGAIKPEVMDYLRALLFRNSEFNVAQLFERLHHFYLDWSDGVYIDQPPMDNLPQRKMQQLKDMSIACGLRQIDVYAGLNVMILLFELHKCSYQESAGEATIVAFRPDGEPAENLDGEPAENSSNCKKLRRIIGYSECLNLSAFADIVGFALSNANLSQADLNSVRLSSADLRDANLNSAYLINAYLSGANLMGANLHRARLSSAELFNANLSHADLSHADLYSAKLFRANLSQANLAEAELLRANLSKADLTDAKLPHANLTDAELRSAKLSNADLAQANLERANLAHAELHKANLSHADLYKANLSNASLRGANLKNANLFRVNLSKADLQDVIWNEETKWSEIKGLEQVQNLSDELKRHLKLM